MLRTVRRCAVGTARWRAQQRCSRSESVAAIPDTSEPECGPTVVIDLAYEQDTRRGSFSVAKQLSLIVGSARKAAPRGHVVFAKFAGEVEQAVQAKWGPLSKWGMHVELEPRDLADVLASLERPPIYLSPHGEEVLEHVDPDRTYIIGGIVDLAFRGAPLSLRRAQELGVPTARLPLKEHFPDASTNVLNVNTCVDLLLARSWEEGGEGWGAAFAEALPQRVQRRTPRVRRVRPSRSAALPSSSER
mmetsp:Transcript_16772/g.54848  ORF Transcript_16772/g.54848 Transcript_16772/m.54848 type:complete len:246 (+) Transcript_16772:53-790(+)